MKESTDSIAHHKLSTRDAQKSCSDKKDFSWTTSTYLAEGLPWSLLHQVTAEFFTTIGVSAAGVGRTSLLHGPMLFKALWSPVVELWGTLRSWMVFTQAAMGVLIGFLAVAAGKLADEFSQVEGQAANFATLPDTTLVWSLLILVGVCSAVHDIACDGFYMENLDEARQARFSGLRIAAYRVAMLIGSSGLVLLGARINWVVAYGAGAALLLVLAVGHYFFLPHPFKENGYGSSGNRSRQGSGQGKDMRKIADSYLSFLRQDSVLVVIAFLILYKMADALMFSMSSVFLARELGIGADLRAFLRFFSVVAGIFGAVWGGVWIARKGLNKTLFLITLLMVGSEPLYAILASYSQEIHIFHEGVAASFETFVWDSDGSSLTLVLLVIIIEQIFGGFATAAQVVFIMRRCNIRHKTAHYAFSTVIISLTHMGLGVGSGVAYESLGAERYFWVVSALALPAVALSLIVPKDSLASKDDAVASS